MKLIEHFVNFLYSGTYKLTTNPPRQGQTSFHIHMYALGDKYDIPKLKFLAKSHLTSTLGNKRTLSEHVLDAIKLIHESTPESDHALRDLIVNTIRARMPDIFAAQDLQSKLSEALQIMPDIGMAIFASYMNQPLLLDCPSCGPSQPAHQCKPKCGNCSKRVDCRCY